MQRRLMRLMSIFFICVMVCGLALSETVQPDISDMSTEELLELRERIDMKLKEKGYNVYFDIERGAKGEEVSAIQEKLAELGYYSGRISGKFDSETQKSFKRFEKENGLESDGVASREDQEILFGDTVVSKATPQPEQDASTDAQKGTYQQAEHDTSFDYEDCLRYPEAHVGEAYTLKGKVEQTIGDRENGFQLRFSVLGNNDEIIFVDVLGDPGYNILEGDWLTVRLVMDGTITYESTWGKSITIPKAAALGVVLR